MSRDGKEFENQYLFIYLFILVEMEFLFLFFQMLLMNVPY